MDFLVLTEVCRKYGVSVYDIRELLDSSVKLMDGKSPLEIELPGTTGYAEETAFESC